jgi:hypothetical protein
MNILDENIIFFLYPSHDYYNPNWRPSSKQQIETRPHQSAGKILAEIFERPAANSGHTSRKVNL